MGKKFTDLGKAERRIIQEWLFQEYCAVGERRGSAPSRKQQEDIVRVAHNKAAEAGIIISIEEVRRYYGSKESRFKKRFERGDRQEAG